jgi:hypothetical protein
MKPYLIGLGLIVAAAVAGRSLLRDPAIASGDTQERPPPPSQARRRAPTTESATERHGAARNEPAVPRMHAPQVITPPVEVSSDSVGEEVEPASVTFVDERDYLQVAFAQQASDTRWASASEAALRQDLNQVVTQGSVGEIQCKSDLCRVDIEHGDEESYRATYVAIMRTGSWEGPGLLARTDGRTWNMVVFFGKPGMSLPTLHD